VATASFMVDPTQAGRCVGRALGEHVLVWGRSAGYRSMQFNALVETNTGAAHLWRSLGFQILTTVPEAFGSIFEQVAVEALGPDDGPADDQGRSRGKGRRVGSWCQVPAERHRGVSQAQLSERRSATPRLFR